MCIAFIRKFKDGILVLHNRDEEYTRSANSLELNSHTQMYHGTDLKQGGTWLALNSIGEFSFVTNIRNKSLIGEDKLSRGELPFKALSFEEIKPELYNPFNLVWGNLDKIQYLNSIDQNIITIQDEVFGISNGTHPNSWPKVEMGKSLVAAIKAELSFKEIICESLSIMGRKEKFNFNPSGTGFSKEQEDILTPIFVESDVYGTVSTTIAFIGASHAHIHEENYINKTSQSYSFELN